jgi:hypothetical protein
MATGEAKVIDNAIMGFIQQPRPGVVTKVGQPGTRPPPAA